MSDCVSGFREAGCVRAATIATLERWDRRGRLGEFTLFQPGSERLAISVEWEFHETKDAEEQLRRLLA
ncbi:hypothetical protein CEP54_016431, partial [Fusarium duplospermum]